MPQREVKNKQEPRQDEQRKESEAERGHRPSTAKQDGAAVTNKTRRMKGK